MIKLKQLTLSGIGRFVEKQVIDFTSLGHLVQVDGTNHSTGGSSGAGKTTVFKALDYLFGISDTPISVLQSRITKDGIHVIGVFDLDGKDLKIERGKGKFFIELNGEITTGNSKVTEEKLDQILAIPRPLFRAMLHKRQKEGGFFMNMTPKQIYEFLTDCLGLDNERKKIEKLDSEIERNTKIKVALETAIQSSQSALSATVDALSSLGQLPVLTVTKERVRALEIAYKETVSVLEDLQNRHAKEALEMEKNRPTFTIASFDRTIIIALEAAISSISDKIKELEKDENNRVASVAKNLMVLKIEIIKTQNAIAAGDIAKREAMEKASQIRRIREAVCYTCAQPWANEQAKAQENKLLQEIRVLKDRIFAAESAKQELQDFQNREKRFELERNPRPIEGIEELYNKKAEANLRLTAERVRESTHNSSENKKKQTIYETFSLKQGQLQQVHRQEISNASQGVLASKQVHEQAQYQLQSHQEASRRYTNSWDQLNQKIDLYTKDIKEKNEILKKCMEELELATESKKAIKNYLSRSFDEALATISEFATNLIRHIPNMANATIQLQGTRETQDGKVKDEVNAVINMDGDVGIPLKSLSGGEGSATDLAVDLAVIDLIETKTNKGIDVFILDEPFTGLDTTCIEMALEVLTNCSTSKKLILVDHNPVVKEMMSNKIMVVREGLTSNIQQQ